MNEYRGVNPHLNSVLQSRGGGWDAFHAHFIQELTAYLDSHLPDGYYATGERSLQVTRTDKAAPRGSRKSSITTPDALIIRSDTPHGIRTDAGLVAAAPFLVAAMDELPLDDDLVMSAAIYRVSAGEFPGELVTRLELISPANKPDGSHYPHYLGKRLDTLLAGICLVEIDLIHERRPFLAGIPSYPDGDSNARPYTIIVSDPRPAGGVRAVYGAMVDEPLPIVDVPLDVGVLQVDFDAIYQRTYGGRRVYAALGVTDTIPVRFGTYNTADQARIKARMAAISTSNG